MMENKNTLNTKNIRDILSKSNDIIFTQIFTQGSKRHAINLIYIEGLVDQAILNNDIVKPVFQNSEMINAKTEKNVFELIEYGVIYLPERKICNNINDVIKEILNNKIAFVFDKEGMAITFSAVSFDKRSLTEPTIESVTKGSKDCFVETLKVNTAILRRRIKNPALTIEILELGKENLTTVALVYLDGIAEKKLIQKARERLNAAEIENIISLGVLEEHIVDNPYSLFPQTITTERPDKFCSNIIEGRIGIIVDGLPLTIIVPATLNQFLQVPEDYSQNYIFASFIRILRYFLMLLTLYMPGFYIAVTTFHQGMIPSELAISISASKIGVPLPTFLEVLIMVIAFEILQEAGSKLPKTIGQSVSIVGAVVIGQSVVNARIVSAIVVVVIAITGMASLAMPYQDLGNAIRIYKFVVIILCSLFGLLGLSISLLFLLFLLCKIETFGIPYLSPFILKNMNELKDSIVRFPLMKIKKKR